MEVILHVEVRSLLIDRGYRFRELRDIFIKYVFQLTIRTYKIQREIKRYLYKI